MQTLPHGWVATFHPGYHQYYYENPSTQAPAQWEFPIVPSCMRNGCNQYCMLSENGFTYYEYCSQYCLQASTTSTPVTNNNKPNFIKCAVQSCFKPVFIEGTTIHKFCGRTCRDKHEGNFVTNTFAAPVVVSNKERCIRPSCTRAKSVGHLYCGRSCGTKHQEENTSTSIHILDSGDTHFQDIKSQFEQKWLHTHKKVPKVKSVSKVVMPFSIYTKWKEYQDIMVQKHPHLASGHQKAGPGNTRRRFHGTRQYCTLGLKDNTSLCSNTKCSVCGILKTSWKVSFAQTNIKNFGRFGSGVYFSSTSSKSDDYTGDPTTSTTIPGGYRSMFVAHAILGKGYQCYKDMTTLTQPPTGYDSVLGEVGQSLNYDEVIVYKDAAAIPLYLIIYKP